VQLDEDSLALHAHLRLVVQSILGVVELLEVFSDHHQETIHNLCISALNRVLQFKLVLQIGFVVKCQNFAIYQFEDTPIVEVFGFFNEFVVLSLN